ncbi:DUF2141 domain-containing protein [Croceibacter atlanticus]|jgi:uncharacterized protein (DUF2141 family)|uniref:DUF2141 domain-containing protein n=1 Tax=Croceibacter atlanticus (strain ATCC BAA-628 / JCM 21780 / CIP 108009 / IAM 15332 / KCTC 12090 / HTCC2559) TaxID=216432 RepID=A3UC01_CROAH|nr:DUF2141 domain-containing protein [Croceibacter atlanticus]EAP86152.1 hypothetical protein CA2559_08966 [Croceibacter atlanticus HTCC2559]MBW4968986.1 DUF2141 domain-containing protein [Croceibacter atlanticus]
MKTLAFAIVLLVFGNICSAQNETTNLEVTINNVKNDNGVVLVALHSEDTFMKLKPVKSLQAKIVDGHIKATFTGIAKGEYAVLAIHDENENGTMDFNTNGMPKESYGASNNDMSFGPPVWSDSKFIVGEENQSIAIRF